MAKRFKSFVRKTAVIFSAGMLYQAGSCVIDPVEGAATLSGFVLQRLVTDIVFGVFNVSTMGF